jgi:hypothetical protein
MIEKDKNGEEYIVFRCPHCQEDENIQDGILVYLKEINCAIFRHGVYKDTGIQIPSHASKEECDKLFKEGHIIECGKPYEILKVNNEYKIQKCEYK